MVPKAQHSFGDEEERTTIESGWEDEPSTTVEQGEVAERVRSMGTPRAPVTNVTNTGMGSLDESTVDDQRVNAAISMMTPAALTVQARLVITGGNDTGHELTVAPGKSYTIGRGIDNDLVLTDIAVSRKHFDLRYERGFWVIADRGSGNGTVINGNIEDAPFTLTNGDIVEIGNTQFRIDVPNSPPRPAASLPSFKAMETVDVPMDEADDEVDEEDEPSTMNGTPIEDPLPALPQNYSRPKTLPPPAPARSRSPSQHQAPAFNGAGTVPPGATTPMQQNPQPNGLYSHQRQPAHLAQTMRPQQAPMLLNDHAQPSPAATLPGQGTPLAPSQLPPEMYGYQNGQHMPNGNMLIVNTTAPRDATSTALVPPTPYGGIPQIVPQPQHYHGAAISRRTKLILGGVGLTLFAAIATVAIIKGGNTPKAPAVKIESKAAAPPAKPDVKPIDPPPPKIEAKIATKPDPKVTEVKPTIVPTVVPKATVETKPTVEVKPEKTAAEKAAEAKADEDRKAQAKATADRKADAKVEQARIAAEKRAAAKEAADAKKQAARDAAAKRAADKLAMAKRTETKPETTTKRVAVDASGAKAKADAQYRAKNFNGAADTLTAAAKGSDDASGLASDAGAYRQLGKAYNVGMAPATPAKEAWAKLQTAQSHDSNVGGAFSGEIKAKLAQIAPKAASAFMASGDFTSAKTAAAYAEANGTGNSTTQAVRSTLEGEAGKLYKAAQAEQSSSPDSAKAKYKQIKGMVDAKSTWYQKATKALAAM